VILAILTVLLLFRDKDKTESDDLANDFNQTSDYSMQDFTMTIMDETGRPSRIISGKDMAHYPEGDSSVIHYLEAHIMKQGEETWLITSDQGDTAGKGEDILLTGNVIINKSNDDGTVLNTEKLHLDSKNNTAYTDVAARFKSPTGVTDTVGFHAVLADETINLHSRVKGKYDAP